MSESEKHEHTEHETSLPHFPVKFEKLKGADWLGLVIFAILVLAALLLH